MRPANPSTQHKSHPSRSCPRNSTCTPCSKTLYPPCYSAPRTRRSYSPQFKAHLVDVCERPGASIAALAREHGINANILHRWRKEHRQSMQSSDKETARVDHHEVDIDINSRIPRCSRASYVVTRSCCVPFFDCWLVGCFVLNSGRLLQQTRLRACGLQSLARCACGVLFQRVRAWVERVPEGKGLDFRWSA